MGFVAWVVGEAIRKGGEGKLEARSRVCFAFFC